MGEQNIPTRIRRKGSKQPDHQPCEDLLFFFLVVFVLFMQLDCEQAAQERMQSEI